MMEMTHKLRLRIHTTNNQTIEAVVDSVRKGEDDDLGALYYVVAVVLIYALSIVMMIASHIRKNKQDNQLRTYLKEMAILRKKDRREKVFTNIGKIGLVKNTNLDQATNKTDSKKSPLIEEKEGDEEATDPLLRKSSNSDDTSDSVFQLTLDETWENSRLPPTNLLMKSMSVSSQPVGRTIQLQESLPKHPRSASTSHVHVHIINEQTAL